MSEVSCANDARSVTPGKQVDPFADIYNLIVRPKDPTSFPLLHVTYTDVDDEVVLYLINWLG